MGTFKGSGKGGCLCRDSSWALELGSTATTQPLYMFLVQNHRAHHHYHLILASLPLSLVSQVSHSGNNQTTFAFALRPPYSHPHCLVRFCQAHPLYLKAFSTLDQFPQRGSLFCAFRPLTPHPSKRPQDVSSPVLGFFCDYSLARS